MVAVAPLLAPEEAVAGPLVVFENEERDELLSLTRERYDPPTVVGHDARRLEVTVRDQDDIGIVEQAVAGAADVLVTGDRDLFEMTGDRPIRILTPRGFWDLLRSGSAEPL